MVYKYKYPRPTLTVDCAVFRKVDDEWCVLLIRRNTDPFKGCWALPGGFVDMHEDLADAAHRELKEETNVVGVHLEQLGAYGAVDRDPRERIVTVVYWGIMRTSQEDIQAGSDASETEWFNINALPKLGFDHWEILQDALKRMKTECSLADVV